MLPPLFLYPLAVVVGLAVGSFLNVVVHRLPRGTTFVRGGSKCPYCGGRVAARDNIPLLSYLLLAGRCRLCGAPISLRYPLLEAATALLFVACVWRFGASPEAAAAILFCCLMLVLAAIDIEHFLLPDSLTLPGILAGLVLQPWLPPTLLEAVVGTLVGAGLLILLINTWYWWRGEEGMGLGDVNMLAAVGAFLGWQGVVLTLLVGAASGALVGIVLLSLRRLGLRSKLPFGAFLALGALAAMFWGQDLVASYLRIL